MARWVGVVLRVVVASTVGEVVDLGALAWTVGAEEDL